MKKAAFVAFVACLFACLMGGAALADMAALETDQELFDFCCLAANWQVPEGFSLEGFAREDLNTDGVVDVVAVLRRDTGYRMMVVIVSDVDSYRVMESASALPTAYGDGADPLEGIEVDAGRIVLHVGGGANGERYRSQYVFAGGGAQFALSSLTSVVWNAETNAAVQNRFDFASGEHSSVSGRMNGDSFSPDGAEETHLFQAGTLGDGLEAFDIGRFPVTWEAFAVLKGGALVEPTEEPLMYCDICGGYFAEGEAFREHACQERTLAFTCPDCGQGFESEEGLAEHVCEPLVPESVACDACGESFLSTADFLNHVCISYPSKGLIYCDVCGESFPEGEAFRDHPCLPE